jgi:hypothetical protein
MKERGKLLVAPVVAFLILTWMFFTLRMLVRIRSRGKLLKDDWFLSISMVSNFDKHPKRSLLTQLTRSSTQSWADFSSQQNTGVSANILSILTFEVKRM